MLLCSLLVACLIPVSLLGADPWNSVCCRELVSCPGVKLASSKLAPPAQHLFTEYGKKQWVSLSGQPPRKIPLGIQRKNQGVYNLDLVPFIKQAVGASCTLMNIPDTRCEIVSFISLASIMPSTEK